MESKRLFQVFVLLTLLFSLWGSGEHVRASTGSDDRPGAPVINPNFVVLQDIVQSQPTVSMVVTPSSVDVDEVATATVSLNNPPAEGYTSAELTCTYDPNVAEASNIVVASLFGIDPAVAINGPHNGRFVVAIAGTSGNKATGNGILIAFNVRGLQAGQTALNCQARVSQGGSELVSIESIPTSLTVLGNPATPTLVPPACDKAEFVADINVPPGTVMSPGAAFTKTWRLTNVGSCAWTTSYQLVFFSGEQMGAIAQISFNINVAVGETVDISLDMTAPFTPGSYRGYWMFKNANGALFGVGPQANQPWFVDIQVSDVTVTPSPPPMTPTISPTTCDQAETTGYVGIPPGTLMSPGATFTQGWGLRNIGWCTWTTGYQLVFYGSEQMGAPLSINIPYDVAPGQLIILSVNFTAPTATGRHTSLWKLRDPSGVDFGIGASGNDPLVVDIMVADLTPTPGGPTPTPMTGVAYDFAANMCTAVWFSGAGQLPCPGIDGDAKGFVFRVDSPKLENGAIDPRPGLLTSPQNVQNGYIQGFYPPFKVQSGDRFRSTLNCDFGATNCYAAFRLDYQVGSDPIKTFWGPFLERYDGQLFSVDVDLSSLAGQDVKFILTVLGAGPATGDRAVWVGPIIYRSGLVSTPVSSETPASESPTPTSTPATITPTFTSTPDGSTTPVFTPTLYDSPTPPDHQDYGMLTGQVVASKPVNVSLYDTNQRLVVSVLADTAGNYTVNAPAGGTYTVVASAPGFLSAQGSATIMPDQTTTLPGISLLPGDIDGSNVIDPFDALTIGMSYNTAVPPAADLNNDGIINVLDLELLAKNYRKTGPVPWQ